MPEVTNNELLAENVKLLKENVRLLQESLEMRKLLAEWFTMDAEPTPGDGLCMTADVQAELDAWNERYSDLMRRTSAALFNG